MIPKTLHYCWFGKKRKPKLFSQCLESWKRHCPDFEIKEWNNENSRQFANSFYRNAIRKKQYAFAADYIRTNVLFEEGGIYLDTDMLVLRPLDDLLNYNFVIGEEVPGRINFALFASSPKHRLLQRMLDFYEQTPFNQFSVPVITHTFSGIFDEESLGEDERIFPPEYFYAVPYQSKDEPHSNFTTEKSYAVHLWDHSWSSEKKNSYGQLCKNLWIVTVDYVFYGYPYAYFKRYFREFSRKIYHRLIGKNKS